MKKLWESQVFWYALIVFLQTVLGLLTATEVTQAPPDPIVVCPHK